MTAPISLLGCEDNRDPVGSPVVNCAESDGYGPFNTLWSFEPGATSPGDFYVFNDNSGNQVWPIIPPLPDAGDAGDAGRPPTPPPVAEIEGEGRCGSQYAMRYAGRDFNIWGEGMGNAFGGFQAWGSYPLPADFVPVPADATTPYYPPPYHGAAGCQGVSFWARAPAPHTIDGGGGAVTYLSFRVSDHNTDGMPVTLAQQLASVGFNASNPEFVAGSDHCQPAPAINADGGPIAYSVPLGQRCDDFGVYLALSRTWQFYAIPFDKMAQVGGGKVFPHIDPSTLYRITITPFPKGESFDLWFDDIGFFGCGPSNAGADGGEGAKAAAAIDASSE